MASTAARCPSRAGASSRPPTARALAPGATYVARGFSGDVKQLADLVQKAIEHKGFSLVDCLSPCVTYNKVNTYDFFRERVYDLKEEGHDPSNLSAALAKAVEWPLKQRDRVPLGVFYETDDVPTYEELEPGYRKGPPLKQGLAAEDP